MSVSVFSNIKQLIFGVLSLFEECSSKSVGFFVDYLKYPCVSKDKSANHGHFQKAANHEHERVSASPMMKSKVTSARLSRIILWSFRAVIVIIVTVTPHQTPRLLNRMFDRFSPNCFPATGVLAGLVEGLVVVGPSRAAKCRRPFVAIYMCW